MQHVAAPYAEARPDIANGDVLLFRPRGWFWRLIATAGRSEYCHAAMAAWWGDHLMCVEMTAGGGRAQLLSNLVARWPGVIDVYRAPPTWTRFSPMRAVAAMIGMTGTRYGRWNLMRAACWHLAVVRCFLTPDDEDGENSKWPPFCSQAVAMAYRAAGLDLVPNLADRLTEPADLSRSALLEYRFTLV